MEQTRGCCCHQNDGVVQDLGRDIILTEHSLCCSAYHSIQPILLRILGQDHWAGQCLLNRCSRHYRHPDPHCCRFHPDHCLHVRLDSQETGHQYHCTRHHHRLCHCYHRYHHYPSPSTHLNRLEIRPGHFIRHPGPYRTCIGLFQHWLELLRPVLQPLYPSSSS